MKAVIKGLLALILVSISFNANSKTLDEVKERGYLVCGVSQSLPGFSFPDDNNDWSGLDVDVCRAVAAAIFGDNQHVKFTPLSAKERFTALQSGEIDLLSRNTTWTFNRDVALGIEFTNVSYYDGQGFMVPKSLGVTKASDLAGATLCTNTGTTTELNVSDYFRSKKMDYSIVTFEKADEVVAAYDAGRCDVYTTDRSGLAANRLKLKNPSDHIILAETISKEPLGPAVRHADNHWGDVVRWVFNGLIAAEEYGVTKANIAKMKKSDNPEVKRLLGVEGSLGEALGLRKDFMQQAIKVVGNYGEIFERNVGKSSKLNLDRGQNALWIDGGLMYSPPFR